MVKNLSAINKFRTFWICLILTLAIIAVFYQVCSYGFVNYDDLRYVYKNPSIHTGITLKAIKWAFTTGYASNWHPLTWLSLILDRQFFGSNAGGYHLTNLVFHIANTLLLFIVLKRMTNVLWRSAFVAALFALHPLHVESVAWVAERKDVLSTFFWLLTMWAYYRYCCCAAVPAAAKRTKHYYILTIVFFALGLMAKPMLVTLPFVLLLLDYWPLKRFGTKRSLPRLLIEKVPLFAMVIVSCIITFIVQKRSGAMAVGESYSFFVRLANAFISYVQYVIKMIWPGGLAVSYPHPGRNISVLYAIISFIFLLDITILILWFSKGRRYLVTGWFWYVGTLVPVIGLIQVGDQAMADRYTYITLTGLFIIIAWGLPELLAKWPRRKVTLWVSSLIVLSVLAVQAHLQQRYWKDSITLFQHALKVTKNNYIAHFCIADALLDAGYIDAAIRHSIKAIQIKPDCFSAVNGLGVALYKAGRIDEAIGYYEKALEISPRNVEVYINLGAAFAAQGKFAEAEEALEKVLLVLPQDADTHNNLGVALFQQGKVDEGIEHFNQAIKIDPDYTSARNNLNLALAAKKQKFQSENTGNAKK